MKPLRLAVFLALAASAFGQGGRPPFYRKSPLDASDMYQRMSASDLVILGTMVDLLSVPEYHTREEIAKIHASGQMVHDFPGILIRISVDEPLCRKTNFQPAPTPGAETPKEVPMFILAEDLIMFDGPTVEDVRVGGKYLLFLTKDQKQAENIARFGLDPKVTYYRGIEVYRGTIRISAPGEETKNPEATNRFVENAKALCRAVSTGNLLEKQRNLGILRFSPDASLRGAAEAALSNLGVDVR